MEGVNYIDENVEKCHTTIRLKMWRWPVFAFCVDVRIQQICMDPVLADAAEH